MKLNIERKIVRLMWKMFAGYWYGYGGGDGQDGEVVEEAGLPHRR
jgi:hypothetical protein